MLSDATEWIFGRGVEPCARIVAVSTTPAREPARTLYINKLSATWHYEGTEPPNDGARFLDALARAAMFAQRLGMKPDADPRLGHTAVILRAIETVLTFENDPRALLKPFGWATKRQYLTGKIVAYSTDLKKVAKEAAAAVQDVKDMGRSRYQAAWALTRALWLEAGISAQREDRRKLARKFYRVLPLDSSGNGVDANWTKTHEPFVADPATCVRAALRVIGVDPEVVKNLSAAKRQAIFRETTAKLAAGKKV